MSELPSSAQRVLDAAETLGLQIDVVEFPDGTRTALDAANAVGCDVGQIVKSLIFEMQGPDGPELVLALTSGSNRVDTKALTAVAGVSGCDRANPEDVREATGFAIGGVPPIGHAKPVRSFFDPALLDFDTVWAAAGTPRHVFEIEPQQLLEVSGAATADFGVPS